MGRKSTFKVLMPVKQTEIPGTEEPPDQAENGLGWKFKLELSVNDQAGGKDKLCVIAGEAPADRIEELVCGAVRSKRFLRKLRGTVGEPLFPSRSGSGAGEDESD